MLVQLKEKGVVVWRRKVMQSVDVGVGGKNSKCAGVLTPMYDQIVCYTCVVVMEAHRCGGVTPGKNAALRHSGRGITLHLHHHGQYFTICVYCIAKRELCAPKTVFRRHVPFSIFSVSPQPKHLDPI